MEKKLFSLILFLFFLLLSRINVFVSVILWGQLHSKLWGFFSSFSSWGRWATECCN